MSKEVKVITNKVIDEIVGQVIGEDSLAVVDFLKDKKNISEFIIAEKVKLDMQTTRNVLYRLHTHNIATYIRRKDRKKGWYISYWTFNRKRIKELIVELKKKRLDKLRDQLKKEEGNQNSFFICSKACARLDFDQATEFDFKCPECGSIMNMQENMRTIEHIKEKIKEIEGHA